MNAIGSHPGNQLPVVHSVGMSFGDIERLAVSVAKSGLFGVKTPEQALALMMVSQAEGRHPALAARDYHIIQGQPTKKAEAMQRDFLAAGGRIEWHQLDDTKADATFSHPQGGTFRCDWDMERQRQAQISNPMWKKYPRQMLRSRVISEGVRTVFPAATSGMYVPEEVRDFEPRPMQDVTPSARTVGPTGKPIVYDTATGEIREELFAAGPTTEELINRFDDIAASGDIVKLEQNWRALNTEQRVSLGAGRGTSGPKMAAWKSICETIKRQGSQDGGSADSAAGGVALGGVSPQPISHASAGGPLEPPADDIPSLNQSLQADSLGLEAVGASQTDNEASANIIAQVERCTTLEAVQQVKDHWRERMYKMPRPVWDKTMVAIGAHETALWQAAK